MLIISETILLNYFSDSRLLLRLLKHTHMIKTIVSLKFIWRSFDRRGAYWYLVILGMYSASVLYNLGLHSMFCYSGVGILVRAFECFEWSM